MERLMDTRGSSQLTTATADKATLWMGIPSVSSLNLVAKEINGLKRESTSLVTVWRHRRSTLSKWTCCLRTQYLTSMRLISFQWTTTWTARALAYLATGTPMLPKLVLSPTCQISQQRNRKSKWRSRSSREKYRRGCEPTSRKRCRVEACFKESTIINKTIEGRLLGSRNHSIRYSMQMPLMIQTSRLLGIGMCSNE